MGTSRPCVRHLDLNLNTDYRQYSMVVPTFVRQALASEPLLVHGDGAQSRYFNPCA